MHDQERVYGQLLTMGLWAVRSRCHNDDCLIAADLLLETGMGKK